MTFEMMLLWKIMVCSISLLKKNTSLETLLKERSVREHWEDDTPKSGCGPPESGDGS